MALRRRCDRTQPIAEVPRGPPTRAVGSPAVGCSSQKKNTNEALSRRAPAKSAPNSLRANYGTNARLPPQQREVVAAVESLYADELKPYGRILRKRLSERSVPGQYAECENAPDVDIRQLRAVCSACSCLRVEDEEGGDWSAVLVNRPANFVDIYSPMDDYPADLWEAAQAYFDSLSGEEMTLPGGRYACAQVLVARRLPFLRNRTLGQICHIVQLAISQKKVLGYLNGSVVPYGKSQSMVKELCASTQMPCSGPGRDASGLQLADWTTAKQCLQEILSTAAVTAQGPGMVPLSNVKRLFRSRFSIELSETMLGHSKLSELLQDERFADVCSVKLEGHGYIVVQKTMHGNPGTHSQLRHSPAVPAAMVSHTMPATIPSKEKVDHNKFHWDRFSPNEPAKVILDSRDGAAADMGMACRRRPMPLSEKVLFGGDYGTTEDFGYFTKGAPMTSAVQASSPHSFYDSCYERSLTESTASFRSAMPSPVPSFGSELQNSPLGCEDVSDKGLPHCRHVLPPPPAIPPPPPPTPSVAADSYMLPPGLAQVVRPPPGLLAPPGLSSKLWPGKMFLPNNCNNEPFVERLENLPEVKEDSPASEGSSQVSGSLPNSLESQRVLCLSAHV